VIQYEQNSGNPGSRTLQLLIGVKPERFDSFYTEVQKIGRILSKSITKTDKTNEYLQLNAKTHFTRKDPRCIVGTEKSRRTNR
jgi:hypothetical protein